MNIGEYLQQAGREHWALGHFNISNLEQLRAIAQAAKECQSPILIGASEGEREFIGLEMCVAMVSILRQETGLPLFLNADHSKSVQSAIKAIDAGFDSIHIDTSALPFNQNVDATKQVVEHAIKVSQKRQGAPISVEGELGYLRGSSKIQNVIIEVKSQDYTDPAQAAEFVLKTGVSRLAIAVGNIHGIALEEPFIDIDRIKAIRKAVPEEIVLVLHAASGITPEVLTQSIEAGIANIHINTEIRLVFAQKLREFLQANPDETTPYKFYEGAIDAVKEKVKEKLQIFGSCGKI